MFYILTATVEAVVPQRLPEHLFRKTRRSFGNFTAYRRAGVTRTIMIVLEGATRGPHPGGGGSLLTTTHAEVVDQ